MSDTAQPAADSLSAEEQAKQRARALVKDGPADPNAAKPAEKNPDEKAADQKPAEDETLDADLKVPPKEKKPKDGPVGIDKALANVQQAQAALRKDVSSILEAIQSGEDVSDDVAKLQERGEKTVKSLRDRALDEEADLLETLVTNLAKVGNIEKRDKDRDRQLEAMRVKLDWTVSELKYPNTDVRKVWDKALLDAEQSIQTKFGKVWETLSEDQKDDVLANEANAVFHQRCKAVESRHESLRTGGAAATQQTTRQTDSPAPTRTTAPSSVGTAAADVTVMQKYMDRARRLIKRNE